MISMPQIQSIRSRRRNGESIASIARSERVSEPTVRKYLRVDDLSARAGCASSCATFRSGRLRHPCRIGAAARPIPLDATRIAAACDGRRRAPGRSRTGCARFRKPALYPLSYKGVAS